MRVIILLSSIVLGTAVFAATPKKLEVGVKPAAINTARIQADIADLNGQIASTEGRIAESLQKAQFLAMKPQKNKVDEALLIAARTEVLSLEQDKAALIAQRQVKDEDLASRR